MFLSVDCDYFLGTFEYHLECFVLQSLDFNTARDDRREWLWGVRLPYCDKNKLKLFFFFLLCVLTSPIWIECSHCPPSLTTPGCAPFLPVASSDTFVLSLMVSLTSAFRCFQNVIKQKFRSKDKRKPRRKLV